MSGMHHEGNDFLLLHSRIIYEILSGNQECQLLEHILAELLHLNPHLCNNFAFM